MSIRGLHVLTDFNFQRRFSHAQLAELSVKGGADVIQFREKTGTPRTRLAMLQDVATVCQASGVHLIVNDYIDLALEVRADGVHLGQEDMPVETARTILDLRDGPTCLIGATCTTLAQARIAADSGADYIGFGPVFPTTSKSNPASVKGLGALADVCDTVSIPVIAVGGITAARVRSVMDVGAQGVAVMSAITTASEPDVAAARIREEMGVLN